MNIKIEAISRDNKKKSDMTNLRSAGFIPAIIYGEGKEGIKISLETLSFKRAYKKSIGEAAFFDIEIEGKIYNSIIKEKQIHPVTREFTHIDFLELHAGKTITLSIPVKYVGDPIGVAEGGLMEILKRDVEVSCLPKDVPEDIVVDVSKLKIGDSIHFGEITLPENLEPSMSDITTLVAVRAPKAAEEEVAVEEEGEGEGAAEGEESTDSEEKPKE
jgi:large subunit ribosomal protein L25